MDLLYDELDELTRAAALRHVEHCQRCRAELNQLRSARELATLTLVDAPDGFEQRLRAAELAASSELPFSQRAARAWTIVTGYAMRPQLAMAALLMLMIGSSLLFLRPRPGTQTSAMQITERGTPLPNQDQVVVPVVTAEPDDDTPVAAPTQLAPAVVPAAPAAAPKPEPKLAASRPHAPEMVAARSALPAPVHSAAASATETPDHSGQEAEERSFAEATRALQAGELDRALSMFDNIAASGGHKAAAAELNAALAAESSQGCAAALPRFDSVSARFPGSALGNKATWRSATCRSKLGQTRRAMLDLEKLMKVPQYRAEAERALIQIAQRPEKPKDEVPETPTPPPVPVQE
jgi:hypothetical protein